MSGVEPAWKGFVENESEALILFEAVLRGELPQVNRRLQSEERKELIQSGNVFIYEQQISGIKRWTDGIYWSSSRVMPQSNQFQFLVYRQKVSQGSPSEGRIGKAESHSKAKKLVRHVEPYARPRPKLENPDDERERALPFSANASDPDVSPEERNELKKYIGSLVNDTEDGPYVPGGLVKKTISVVLGNGHYRMVSYYTVEDARNKTLRTVKDDPNLRFMPLRPELEMKRHYVHPNGTFPSNKHIYSTNSWAPGMSIALKSQTNFQESLGLPYQPLRINSSSEEVSSSRHDSDASSYQYPSSNYSGESYPSSACPSVGTLSFSSNYSSASYPSTQPTSQVYYSPTHGLPTPTQIKQENYQFKPSHDLLYRDAGEYDHSSQKPPLSVCTDNRNSMTQYTHYGGHITPISATPQPTLVLPPPEPLPMIEHNYGRGTLWSEDSDATYRLDTFKMEQQPRWTILGHENV